MRSLVLKSLSIRGGERLRETESNFLDHKSSLPISDLNCALYAVRSKSPALRALCINRAATRALWQAKDIPSPLNGTHHTRSIANKQDTSGGQSGRFR